MLKQVDKIVNVNPNFAVALYLRLIKNQLHSKMQMRRFHSIDILLRAIPGHSYITDGIPGVYNRPFLDSIYERMILL